MDIVVFPSYLCRPDADPPDNNHSSGRYIIASLVVLALQQACLTQYLPFPGELLFPVIIIIIIQRWRYSNPHPH
jgi:hypothetical protein